MIEVGLGEKFEPSEQCVAQNLFKGNRTHSLNQQSEFLSNIGLVFGTDCKTCNVRIK